jgi:hypothetical protein
MSVKTRIHRGVRPTVASVVVRVNARGSGDAARDGGTFSLFARGSSSLPTDVRARFALGVSSGVGRPSASSDDSDEARLPRTVAGVGIRVARVVADMGSVDRWRCVGFRGRVKIWRGGRCVARLTVLQENVTVTRRVQTSDTTR